MNMSQPPLDSKGDKRKLRVVVEQHPNCFVAYPIGLDGTVVGEGNTFEEAVADVTSAIRFHVETFGSDLTEADAILDVTLTETEIAV